MKHLSLPAAAALCQPARLRPAIWLGNGLVVALLAVLACLCLPGLAWADATEPSADIAGARDVTWLKRYTGSHIVSYSHAAYDEYTFPTGPLKRSDDEDARDEMNNRVFAFTPQQALEGERIRLVYLLPAGRSPLEALRGYEQELKALDASKAFECATAACGGDTERSSSGGGGEQSVAMKLWPEARITEENFSNGHCAQTPWIADQRFASFTVPGKGRVLVHAYSLRDELYCKAFNERTIAVIDVLVDKAREQNMATVSADEMSTAIAQTGRVALYGIHFDTASATIKPESRPALEQIAALLKQHPTMKLHVVGHTDSQGGLESNFTLSRQRAEAVKAALIGQFGIASDRLGANGVSYLAPIASNADEAGRAKNRRVELVPF